MNEKQQQDREQAPLVLQAATCPACRSVERGPHVAGGPRYKQMRRHHPGLSQTRAVLAAELADLPVDEVRRRVRALSGRRVSATRAAAEVDSPSASVADLGVRQAIDPASGALIVTSFPRAGGHVTPPGRAPAGRGGGMTMRKVHVTDAEHRRDTDGDAARAAARHDVSFRDRCKGLLRRAQEARRKRTRRYLANRTEIDSLRAEVRARLRSHSPATDDDRALLRRLALLLTGSAARQAVQDVPWRG